MAHCRPFGSRIHPVVHSTTCLCASVDIVWMHVAEMFHLPQAEDTSLGLLWSFVGVQYNQGWMFYWCWEMSPPSLGLWLNCHRVFQLTSLPAESLWTQYDVSYSLCFQNCPHPWTEMCWLLGFLALVLTGNQEFYSDRQEHCSFLKNEEFFPVVVLWQCSLHQLDIFECTDPHA